MTYLLLPSHGRSRKTLHATRRMWRQWEREVDERKWTWQTPQTRPHISHQQQPTMTRWRTRKLIINSILLHMEQNLSVVQLHGRQLRNVLAKGHLVNKWWLSNSRITWRTHAHLRQLILVMYRTYSSKYKAKLQLCNIEARTIIAWKSNEQKSLIAL